MKNINLAGNIGKDAVVRRTQNGDAVAGFSVAVNDRKKNTTWFSVSLWGKRGEALAQYLTKGTQVAVNGDLSTREHDGKTYLEVNANDVTLMGGGKRDDSGSQGGSSSYSGGGAPADLDGDSIPF